MGRDRRAFLAAAGVGAVGVLAGCSGGNDEMTTEEVNETLDGTETDTPTETATATPEPLMEGEEAYEDARLTDGDVQSIRFEEFDHNIPGVERLVETSYEEENLDARLQRARTRQDALQRIFEFASRTVEYGGKNWADDEADDIAVMRELVHHADEYSDFSFDYEDTMIDEHTVYAGALGQNASILFKDEDGEWNHHYGNPLKADWFGPAAETDYFSEDPGHVASTQSPRGFWGYFDAIGAFGRNSDTINWPSFEKETSNFEFGKNYNPSTRVYFSPETYQEEIPKMLREDVGEYVKGMRYLSEVMDKNLAEAVEFSYDGEKWQHEEVEQDSSRFEDMMKYGSED